MSAYAHVGFRVTLLRTGPWRVRTGEIFVSTHRAESDVPLLCSQFYWVGGVGSNRPEARLHFAARDDMFDRGFFAGFPPGLSRSARTLLYPIKAGPWLPRVRVNPVPYPSAAVLRVGRALESVPQGTPLEEVLPPDLVVGLAERAREAGLPQPSTARDVLRGAYADLLWESYDREVLGSPLLEEAWRERANRAAEDVRRVVELVRSGAPVLFFPEGRPSPDGAIGPLREGMRLLVRRGQPQALVPVGIAYDPLTTGRPWAFIAVGAAVEPPRQDVDATVLDLLRRTTPLTCGQVGATLLLDAAGSGREEVGLAELDRALEGGAIEARAEGRPVDRAFLEPAMRRRRLTGFVRWLERTGLAEVDGLRSLRFDPRTLTSSSELARAALERASAQAVTPPATPRASDRRDAP
jgi:hypothetical protein